MPVDLTQGYQIDPAELPDEAVLFGHTDGMRVVRAKINRVANSPTPVLIQGECGTGKEVVAKFLHTRSARRDEIFAKLNCAAIPAGVFERELLGYEGRTSGAANELKLGLVEIADAGTILIDQVGDLNLELQAKFVRVLRDGRFVRVGGTEVRITHARFIFASAVDLADGVDRGTFRRDLFDRLQATCLHLLPLRERKADIPELSEYLMHKLVRRFGRSEQQHLAPAALDLLEQWYWPGNLRELENSIARIIILGCEEELNTELRRRIALAGANSGLRPALGYQRQNSSQAASTTPRATILRVLQANQWNRRKTAEELKMSYRSLLHELRDEGLPVRRRSHKGPSKAE